MKCIFYIVIVFNLVNISLVMGNYLMYLNMQILQSIMRKTSSKLMLSIKICKAIVKAYLERYQKALTIFIFIDPAIPFLGISHKEIIRNEDKIYVKRPYHAIIYGTKHLEAIQMSSNGWLYHKASIKIKSGHPL